MPRKVDIASPIPRYFQVYQSLKERIQAGEFAGQQPLPAERQLTDDYGVSRITIVKALDQLKVEGWIQSQHGRGTFVKSQPLSNSNRTETLFNDNFSRQGIRPDWELLGTAWLSSPPEVVDALALSANQKNLQITALIKVDGEPIALHQAHIPQPLAMSKQLETLTAAQLLEFIRQTPVMPKRSLEAIAADKAIASTLQVAVGTPLLGLDLLYLNERFDILQHSRTLFRGDRFRFEC